MEDKYFYDAEGKQFKIIGNRKLTLWERIKILFGGIPPNTELESTIYQFTGSTKELE